MYPTLGNLVDPVLRNHLKSLKNALAVKRLKITFDFVLISLCHIHVGSQFVPNKQKRILTKPAIFVEVMVVPQDGSTFLWFHHQCSIVTEFAQVVKVVFLTFSELLKEQNLFAYRYLKHCEKCSYSNINTSQPAK